MAEINLANVSVDIPVYDAASGSIRKLILASTIGGRFVEFQHHLVANALRNISFDVQQGDRIGLVGANGSGKTTLLRVLSGVYAPTSGSVSIDGRVSPLFDISLGMSMDATGIENIQYLRIPVGPHASRDRRAFRRDNGVYRARWLPEHAGPHLFRWHAAASWVRHCHRAGPGNPTA